MRKYILTLRQKFNILNKFSYWMWLCDGGCLCVYKGIQKRGVRGTVYMGWMSECWTKWVSKRQCAITNRSSTVRRAYFVLGGRGEASRSTTYTFAHPTSRDCAMDECVRKGTWGGYGRDDIEFCVFYGFLLFLIIASSDHTHTHFVCRYIYTTGWMMQRLMGSSEANIYIYIERIDMARIWSMCV